MRRKTTTPLSISILAMLAVVVSACNWTSLPATSDTNATQTAFSFAFAQLAGTPSLAPTATNTPTPSATLDPYFQTATAQYSSAYLLTPVPRPPYYTLQLGEFPYCIARRFNVDPNELLAINYLSSGLIYAPGLVLTIPQSGRPFPTARALRPHPVTYTVPAYQTTVYRVACYFGDVDPLVLIQYNRLTSPFLTVGQVLQIP